MRPLVVFTGQGVSLAERFDLVAKLQAMADIRPYFDLVPPAERNDLDAVLRACGDQGEEPFDKMIRRARDVCYEARSTGRYFTEHRRVFDALATAAHDRLVLHVTANIDGFASWVAVSEFDAVWRPRRERCDFRQIARDVRDRWDAHRGVVHFPAHGEVGLLADRTAEGARIVLTVDRDEDLDPGLPRPWSTVYQGIGRNRVREVGERMAFSGIAFSALVGLLNGDAVTFTDTGVIVPMLPAADFIVMDYAAGSNVERDDYPLERRIDGVVARARPSGTGARWTAICYKPGVSTPDRCVKWFTDRGFTVVPHGDGDLGATLANVLAGV